MHSLTRTLGPVLMVVLLGSSVAQAQGFRGRIRSGFNTLRTKVTSFRQHRQAAHMGSETTKPKRFQRVRNGLRRTGRFLNDHPRLKKTAIVGGVVVGALVAGPAIGAGLSMAGSGLSAATSALQPVAWGATKGAVGLGLKLGAGAMKLGWAHKGTVAVAAGSAYLATRLGERRALRKLDRQMQQGAIQPAQQPQYTQPQLALPAPKPGTAQPAPSGQMVLFE